MSWFLLRQSRRWRPALLAIALVPLVLLIFAYHRDVAAQAVSTKLATVLQDLASVVPQDAAGAPLPTPAAVAPLDVASLPKSVQDAMLARHVRINRSNEIQVYVLLASADDATVQALAAGGATIEIADPAQRRVQARVPIARLQAIAALPFVTFVRPPTYAVRMIGAATTEGDAILRGDVARQQFSLDGTGVKVGVISDGLKGVFAAGCTSCAGVAGGPIGTGDLPSATGTRSLLGTLTASSGGITGRSFQADNDLEGLPAPTPPCGFAGAGAEGTALLEIVHDLAPGAQLSFANADTDLAFNQAVNFLAANNDIVVDDLGFFGQASDGTSPVSTNTAAALNNPANRIRTYVTSAGNGADNHYLGNFANSGVDGATISGITNGGALHLFQPNSTTVDVLGQGNQPFNVIALPRGGEVVIVLTWDDRFGASGNNYDLYLVDSTGKVVGKGTDVQAGAQDPVDFIDYVNNTTASDLFHIVIQNVGNRAQPKQLNLFSFQPECANDGPRLLANGHHERLNFNTATRSLSAQSDAGGSPVSVISVGAICSGSAAANAVFAGSPTPNESCSDRNHATIEFYSGQGPTLDGRVKPDISAIDGVAITASGAFVNPFFGTSAAAPHVAGAAALVLQATPCFLSGAPNAVDATQSRAALRNLILSGAVPLTNGAPDNTFGAGVLDAFASVQKTLPVRSGAAGVTVVGNTASGARVTASDLGFSDPNGCGLTRLAWTGGCGTSPDSALTCPFGTTHVKVSASNNGSAFSSPSDVDVTVVGFAIGASPSTATINAGQSATFQMTLTAQGGPFAGSVALGCANLPPQTTCAFSPATVTPGAVSAQASLTITTVAPSAAALHPPSGLVARWTPSRAPWLWLAGAIALTGLTMFGAPAGRRARRASAIAVSGVVLAGLVVQTACGGGSGSGGNNGGNNPPPGSTAPVTSLAPTSLTFGAQTVQATSSPQSVTLTNTGTAALSIAAVTTAGDFAQTNTCGASVAAGATCAIAVTFKPTAAGARTGTLSVSDNATGSPHTVALSGTGVSQTAGTPAGTYAITVTGTSGALTQSSAVTLVVR